MDRRRRERLEARLLRRLPPIYLAGVGAGAGVALAAFAMGVAGLGWIAASAIASVARRALVLDPPGWLWLVSGLVVLVYASFVLAPPERGDGDE